MSDESGKALERLLLLAASARERFQSATELSRQLSSFDHSQKVIVEELAEVVPDFSTCEKALADSDAEIDSLDSQIVQLQELLCEMLSEGVHQKQSPNDLLLELLDNCQSILLELSKESAQKGQPNVSVLEIVQLEDHITQTVDSFIERGLYPETESDAQARLEKREVHAQRLVDFLGVLQRRLDSQISRPQ
jgi:hypothetical protein